MPRTCSNCHAELPDGARACERCENAVEGTESIDIAAVMDIGNRVFTPEEAELLSAMALQTTQEEFVRQVMVGDCPKCESDQTRDCDNDPDINDSFVGHCLECGHYWCVECGKTLSAKHPGCACYFTD